MSHYLLIGGLKPFEKRQWTRCNLLLCLQLVSVRNARLLQGLPQRIELFRIIYELFAPCGLKDKERCLGLIVDKRVAQCVADIGVIDDALLFS
jgi:hypothetical protein